MPDIFYQHKILEKNIDLIITPLNIDSKFSGNILDFYIDVKNEELKLDASAKVSDITSVLPSEYKDHSEYLDLLLLVKSTKSIFRKCYIFEKKGNIFKTTLNLNKRDWRNEVEISALLTLKKDVKEQNGYASSKGTKLGWSTAYKIYFDEPEEKSGGASMELKWESFSSPKLSWLNEYYSKDIYTLDISRGNKMPKIYLNSDMDNHLRSLIEEKSTRASRKTSSRDLMFQTISNSIFTQLLTESLLDLHNNIQEHEGSGSDKEVVIETAWEELVEWKKKMIENYSHKILPSSRKKDALENLKEKIYYEKDAISEISRKILNIAQNSSDYNTQKVFTDHARLLLREEKK